MPLSVTQSDNQIGSIKRLSRVLVILNICVAKSHASGINAVSNEGTLNKIVS